MGVGCMRNTFLGAKRRADLDRVPGRSVRGHQEVMDSGMVTLYLMDNPRLSEAKAHGRMDFPVRRQLPNVG